ncbi:MAG: serine hydrolase domain-containing protein, partial [Tepidiformaceae bacterium]
MGTDAIHGFCKPGFEGVRDAFGQNFAQGLEVGASFAATVDGKFVVDIWSGSEDAAKTKPWRQDTLMNVFSTTKAMTAICLHMLADRGLVDFDAPVARYWPEFAQNGKAGIPVRQLVSHQGGLPSVSRKLPGSAFYDWGLMIESLAEEAPWWEPGTANGYHAVTFGYLAGEVIRRVSGRSVGTFFREEVAEPLNADFHIGFGPALDQRVGEMIPAPVAGGVTMPPDSLLMRVMTNP